MINGHLSEAHQGFAVLEEVEKDTFVRFIRWVYSKDYPALQHTVIVEPPSSSETTQPKPPDPDDDWGFWGTTKKKKKKKGEAEKGGSGSLKETFISHQYDLEETWNANPPPAPRSNKGSEEDYSGVFLCHAKLYVFAEKYDIQPLKKLALKKLHQTLAIFTLYMERVGDITTLLKYVYANTSESKPDVDDIRSMLAHYIGFEMETLHKEGEIKEMLSENNEMLDDFLCMFAQKVS